LYRLRHLSKRRISLHLLCNTRLLAPVLHSDGKYATGNRARRVRRGHNN
jgi:hypothetical protein